MAQELFARESLEARVTAHRQVGQSSWTSRPEFAIASYSFLHHVGERFHVLLVRRVVLVGLETTAMVPGDTAVMNPSVTFVLASAAFMRAMSFTSGVSSLIVIGPLQTGACRWPNALPSPADRGTPENRRDPAASDATNRPRTGQAVTDVGGVADLARLAVADHVDADFAPACDDSSTPPASPRRTLPGRTVRRDPG
jgi:hypothetical protein